MNIFDAVARIDITRMQRYQDNLDFYASKQWSGTADAHLRRERRMTLNYARLIVGKITSYVLSDLDFAVDPQSPEDTERAAEAERELYRVYDDHNLGLLDFDTELDTAILGDGAYRVVWDPAQHDVAISAPDVQGIWAWRSADGQQLVRVISKYQLDNEAAQRDPDLRAFGERRVDVIEDWTAERFERWARVIDAVGTGQTVHLRSEPNPYGWVPYIVYPNIRKPKEPWGESDIEAIREICIELNREASILSNIMELSGNPVAVLENVDIGSEGIQIKPGAVWELPERARAYLLDLLSGGAIGVHLDYLQAVMRALHDLGEAPRTAFGDNARNLSGVALEVELQPLLQRVKRKRLMRTAVHKARNRMILQLLSRYTGRDFAPFRSRVIWGAVTPRDRSAEVRDQEILVRAGIHSRERAADTLGVEDSAAEFERWMTEERAVAALTPAARTPATSEPTSSTAQPA